MPYRNIVAYQGLCFLIGAVNYRLVLDIYPVPDGDGMNISADHCIKPDGAVISHHHFTCNCRIFSKKAVPSKNRSYSANRYNKCHIFGLLEYEDTHSD